MEREPGRVFISYAHKDEKWLEQLQLFLRPQINESNIDVWSDRRIAPGDRWRSEIERELSRASVAVLLVTPAFLGSSFIATNELPPLLRAAEAEGLRILWVPVSHSGWQSSQLQHFQSVLNDPDKPLSSLKGAPRDKAMVEIAAAIVRAASVPAPQAADLGRLLFGRSNGTSAIYENWYDIPWVELLRQTTIIECAVSYMDTWINNAANGLEAMLARGGTIRFYLPAQQTSAAQRVVERFPEYSQEVIDSKISNTKTKLEALRRSAGDGHVEVIETTVFNMYCLMRLDSSVLLVSPYDHFRNNRIQNPTFVIDLDQFPAMAAWAEKEFTGFREHGVTS